MSDLTDALAATGATLAFDAIGGGKLAGQILSCMEAAINRNAKEYSRYGSTTHKQVYLYGGLDTGPTEFSRNFGMTWGMGGWLLFPFLQKVGPATRPGAEEPGRRRAEDDLRQPLLAAAVDGRGAAPRQHRRLQQARHRREGADRAAPRLSAGPARVAETAERSS